MYECMERVLIGDAKTEFRQQANLAGSHTVAYFTTVMYRMTAHIFPTYKNRDQRQLMQMYLREPTDMIVSTFTSRLLWLNIYLAHFPPDSSGQ